MAPVPMRSNPQDTGHRARVAEPISSRATARPSSSSSTSSTSLSAAINTTTSSASSSSSSSSSDNIINNNTNGNSNSSNSSSNSSSSGSVSSSSNAAPNQQQTPTSTSANFEYDDNEWDIGIGNLIIDLDADIEKTNEGVVGASSTAAAVSLSTSAANNVMSANNATGSAASKATAAAVAAAAAAKMAVEHSATVDKGLKMKIKRTKPGTKTSEAKHEIVKSNEQNGNAEVNELKSSASKQQQQQHPSSQGPGSVAANSVGGPPNNILTNSNSASSGGTNGSGGNTGSSKRGSSSHRRDKARDKHGSSGGSSGGASAAAVTDKQQQQSPAVTLAAAASGKTLPPNGGSGGSSVVTEVNGLVRVNAGSGASQIGLQRPVFPASTGPGPPTSGHNAITNALPPSPVPSPAQNNNHSQQQCGPVKLESKPSLNVATTLQPQQAQQQHCQGSSGDDSASSPPPAKKLKSEPKEVTDVCIGTSVGTITEPDCLGPCEPGTSVTLEGIVWHETEGGVLVVNVTWRGKTYVGTLLDCTRHDWAPPRFCDSPTSDLDARLPKGRETRSSVHSKLRNGGGGVKGRRGTTNGPPTGSSTAPSSPTPFVPPRPEPNNKRKNKSGEDDNNTANTNNVAKKSRVAAPPSAPNSSCGSPPPSPVLLECPEPNCSKKYKHINGLKYHQSHAHGGGGSADDEDTKDVTSMSENDESNIEAPSPVTPVKSPEKPQDNPLTPQKKESAADQLPLILRSGSGLLEVHSQTDTPRSTPPSPATPQSIQDLGGTNAGSPTVPIAEPKNVVKPGVLRYNSPEEFPVGVFAGNKSISTGSPIPNSVTMPLSRSMNGSDSSNDQTLPPPEQPPQPQSFASQLQTQINMTPQSFDEPPSLLIPTQNTQNVAPLQPTEQPSFAHQPPSPQSGKLTQFKVKPASALMPDEKNKDRNNKPPNYKKKSRKSPAGSPHPPQSNQDQIMFGMESSGRDEVQSPAYSDISDDGAPVIEPDVTDKNKSIDKKTETSQAMPHMPQYGMYPFYGQPQYIMPSVQDPKPKEPEKTVDKVLEKEPKKDAPDYQQKVIQQHYYPSYGYVPGYSYNMDPSSYGSVSIVSDDKSKEERLKEDVSPVDHVPKQPTPIHNPIQVPTPGKIKTDLSLKEKHQNENHQILKESIEMKSQMNPYMYQKQQQQHQQQQQQQQHHGQREEDMRRFYVYSDQRRKEQLQQLQQSVQNDHKSSVPNKPLPQSPSVKSSKEKIEEKKEKEIKQEGVKPTMETQGPPPPPTSQYAYIHPSYMQSPHYGALPFDPNHPMYRSIMVPGPYSGNPYLHPQIPRYHAPEDLSRAPPPTKALDMLQHHAQYYSSHKIHELQERAIKSPNPKTSIASSSPSNTNGPPGGGQPQTQVSGPTTSQPSNTAPQGGKQTPGDNNKDSRSPPPQRHVHTHHHTHVGLGYPMYPAPYGAAVLASQQAAAVTVINPYPPK